ncbi:MAG: NAD-dependent deacylase [Desulfobacteraceae bacterium]|nr:NAD-dependent deacylase [Desulfobacteraceae bacterium]
MIPDLCHRAARDIAGAHHIVALTGAGISVESGIPPFRGPGGIWEKLDPMEYAHIDAFMRDPGRVWRVLIADMKTLLDQARPNDAHMGLVRLERMGKLKTIITQNVDGLHQAAGSHDVIEFHGNFAWQRCLACGRRISTTDVEMAEMPPRCSCGGILRPECVFFGEMIEPVNLSRSRDAAARCDVMLVVGTSAMVQPAALMPTIARQAGATVIEINFEPTPLTGQVAHYSLLGEAGATFNAILAALEREFQGDRKG